MTRSTLRWTAALFALAGIALTTACRDSARSVAPEGSDGAASAVPSSSCDVTVPAEYGSIQEGVDAATSGDKVCVAEDADPSADGTQPYTEQVVITKSLILAGFGNPVVEPPADPANFAIVESAGSIWEPVLFAYGGSASGGTVSGSEVIEVDVQGLIVDGDGRQPVDDANRAVGIFYRNAEGEITDNTVRDMAVGGQETMGILAYGDSQVRIEGNTVDGYERGGIGVNGDGGAHPSPEAVIANNEITGSGNGSQTAWGPNGIQVGFGASARVTDNTVERNRWNDDFSAENTLASCILIFESDEVNVKDNTVRNCDAGIAVGAYAWFLPSADNTKIADNRVEESVVGVFLRPVAFPGFSSADASTSNAKINGNALSAGSIGEVGIAITPLDASEDYDAIARNNKVVRNTISGFADKQLLDDGTDTKNPGNNVIQP